MADPAAAAAGSTTFIALGKGTASHWHGDALRCEAGHERRGGGLFLSHETGVSFRRKIFFLNGPVKDGGGIYLYDCHDVTIARIVRACSMGFISQIFYDLARHYYEGCADDQRRLEFLFRSLAAIDDYFCLETLAGDNLQVTAVRRNDFRPASRACKPSGTFRDGYTVRPA